MDYSEAIDHEPTRTEAERELARHGSDWEQFRTYCDEFGMNWSEAGVLLGFLGY